ncbi:hemin importer ATP-binding subunit [Anaerohalosphaera lusitana]|uniref:Hemin importer ATP-binding subunit n=1 Tax=Anaerohalosphaera lusitana TaxID=1936003 RepID=A0A1U9NKJ2_9BACT|nr:AAA family ATPase [Anaerohalosphaera lusitana]AQT68036.1 hemin importer ATP-binding subunit [Anaerohalosphaera lusitana]
MHKVTSIKIDNLWGEVCFKFDFFQDVTFLIGVNGSGKTTIINLIAAALSADFQTLDRIHFDSITIELSETDDGFKPFVYVIKDRERKSPCPAINYKIVKGKDNEQLFSLDDFVEDRLRRRMSSRHYYYQRRLTRGILSELKSLVNLNWLSIHRGALDADEETYESSVDQKLDEVCSQLSKYFSVLSSEIAEEIEDFQKDIIVSLLVSGNDFDEVVSLVETFNMSEEAKKLVEIFTKLNIAKEEASKENIYKRCRKVKTTLQQMIDGKLDWKDMAVLLNAYRSHKVVEDWNKLLEEQAKILTPRKTFVTVLNDLFTTKDIRINERNEVEGVTKSGKVLAANNFSSGEKQLLIMLGEALLQESKAWVYIADEPELSLHVSWQEKLVSNLLTLNPRAQILCATHSPDIVSVYSDRVYKVGEDV